MGWIARREKPGFFRPEPSTENKAEQKKMQESSLSRNPQDQKLSIDSWPAAMWDYATPRARENWCVFAKLPRESWEQDWCYLFESERAALLPVLTEFMIIRDAANQAHREQIKARARTLHDRRALVAGGV